MRRVGVVGSFSCPEENNKKNGPNVIAKNVCNTGGCIS